MKLTNRHIRILSFIKKPKSLKTVLKKFDFETFDDFAYYMFYQNKLLFSYEQEPICDDTLICATYEAIAEVDEYKRLLVRSYIPITISIIALIKSCDREILWLLKQLMQLLK